MRLFPEAEDVGHAVEAGGHVAGPEGGADGAAGEDLAAGGLVAELDAFAGGGRDRPDSAHKYHRMTICYPRSS